MADEDVTKPNETKPNKPGYKTTEFYLTIFCGLLGALWGSGLISEGSQFDKLIGFLAMALSTMGYTVSRGFAKRPPSQGGFADIRLLALMPIAMLALAASCGWLTSETKRAKDAVVDCTKPDLSKLVDQFAPATERVIPDAVDGSGGIDWEPVREATKAYVGEVGGCVMASAIQRVLTLANTAVGSASPQSAGLQVNPALITNQWEGLRKAKFEGARYKTSAGEL